MIAISPFNEELFASLLRVDMTYVELGCKNGETIKIAQEFVEQDRIFVCDDNAENIRKLKNNFPSANFFCCNAMSFLSFLPRFRKSDAVLFCFNTKNANFLFDELDYIFSKFWSNPKLIAIPLPEFLRNEISPAWQRVFSKCFRTDVLLQFEQGADSSTILVIEHK